jgi:glucarate dehydratase
LGFFTHKNALNSSTAYSSKWLPLVRATSPSLTEMQMILVAGHDSMLMKLSGAHGPYFTRNIAILKDSAGNTGGEKIRQTLEDARPLLVGQPIGAYQTILTGTGGCAGSR